MITTTYAVKIGHAPEDPNDADGIPDMDAFTFLGVVFVDITSARSSLREAQEAVNIARRLVTIPDGHALACEVQPLDGVPAHVERNVLHDEDAIGALFQRKVH